MNKKFLKTFITLVSFGLLFSCFQINNSSFASNFSDVSNSSNRELKEWKYGEYSVQSTELYFTGSHGRKIHGYRYRPIDFEDDKYPTILLAHGLGSRAMDIRNDATAFSKHGFQCFTFDFCGGGPGTKSDGLFSELTIDSEIEDYEVFWNYVTSDSSVDKDNLFTFGASFGAAITVISKVKYKLQPKASILEYPAFDFSDELPDHLAEIGAPKTLIESVKPYINHFNMEYLGNYNVSTLIMHGDNDTMVDISNSFNALKYLPRADLQIVEGGGHTFGWKENKNIVWPSIISFLIEKYN